MAGESNLSCFSTRFTYETRTLRERNLDASIVSGRLCNKRYARLPRGYVVHELNTTYQFCHALHAAAANEGELTRAAALMTDVTGRTCSAHSQVAKFTFLTPFDRACGQTLPFVFLEVRLCCVRLAHWRQEMRKRALIRSVFQCCIASKCWIVPTPPRKRLAIGSAHQLDTGSVCRSL